IASASPFPTMTPLPVAILDASFWPVGLLDLLGMLVGASASRSGLFADFLHTCCPSVAAPGPVAFHTCEAATVLGFRLLSPMMRVPSGTTALTPRVWLSARASAAGILAATALRSHRALIFVAPTCLS